MVRIMASEDLEILWLSAGGKAWILGRGVRGWLGWKLTPGG
jgi:hypothetical protein